METALNLLQAYERDICKMGKKNKKKKYSEETRKQNVNVPFEENHNTDSVQTEPDTKQEKIGTKQETEVVEETTETIKKPISKKKKFAIGAAITTIVIFVGEKVLDVEIENWYNNVKSNFQSFLEIPSRLDDMDSTLLSLNDSIVSLDETYGKDHEDIISLKALNDYIQSHSVVIIGDYKIETKTVNNEMYFAEPPWISTDVIANDSLSDKVYKAEDLYNIPIIIPYEEAGNEIYFSGQFNDKNHWNGRCILNAYNDNKLVSVLEAVYDDGEIYSYKRISIENDTWSISDRINRGDYNSGDRWVYVKTRDFTKSFTKESVTLDQIISVDDFLNSTNEPLLSHYHGNTSNGLYNDNTGNAYLIMYFKPGEIEGTNETNIIRTLYRGGFENGQRKDDTNKAWHIARRVDTDYMYFKGKFDKDDTVQKGKYTFENNLTQQRINELLEENNFHNDEGIFYIE